LTFAFASLLFGTLRAIKQAEFEPAMPEKDTSISLLLLVTIFLSFGCEKSTTGPEPFKDPRTYTWTIDTLHISNYQILLGAVWGTSDNLYAVGHSSSSAGTMWHFDGNKWSNVKLGLFEGGTIPAPYELSAIHGLSSDNIFAVGRRWDPAPFGASFIIHYDGKQWSEQQAPAGSYYLLDVWANAPNDVWACGINGTLLHYDGMQWKRDSLVVLTPPGSTFYLLSIARIPSGEMFMLGAAYQPGSLQIPERWTYYFFRREGEAWKLVDTFTRSGGERGGKWGGYRLAVLPTGTMYSVDSYGVFQWNGTQWINRYSHINNTTSVFGTSDNNLFITGVNGLLVHYNGLGWFEYSNLVRQNTGYMAGWSDEKQAFVLGWLDGEKTVVLRGR